MIDITIPTNPTTHTDSTPREAPHEIDHALPFAGNDGNPMIRMPQGAREEQLRTPQIHGKIPTPTIPMRRRILLRMSGCRMIRPTPSTKTRGLTNPTAREVKARTRQVGTSSSSVSNPRTRNKRYVLSLAVLRRCSFLVDARVPEEKVCSPGRQDDHRTRSRHRRFPRIRFCFVFKSNRGGPFYPNTVCLPSSYYLASADPLKLPTHVPSRHVSERSAGKRQD